MVPTSEKPHMLHYGQHGPPTQHSMHPCRSFAMDGRVAWYVCTSKYVQYERAVCTYVGVAKYAYFVR
eukprot:359054-Chlamydomonas_euryale.AAC.2